MRSNTQTTPNLRCKFAYVLVLQLTYGDGFEDVTCYDRTREGRKDARADIREYRSSGDGATYRIITRRVPMADYLTGRF